MSDREFTLKYEFKNVGILEHGQELNSPREEHFGVEWNIRIQKWGDLLRMFFFAYHINGRREIHVDYTKKILSKNKENTYSISGSKELKSNYGPCTFIDWGHLESEFLNDGKLDAEIYLKITKMIRFPLFRFPTERKNYGRQMPIVGAPMGHSTSNFAIPRKQLRSFGEDMRQFSDVILKVKDRKFYVSKLTLSSQSPYFATLFLGHFQESGKSEIELKNVNPEDLQYYLEVIYAEDGVDEYTVARILQIADMYQTPLAIRKCEKYLIEKSKMELKKKMELAGKYRLEELKKVCMNQIRSKEDIRSVVPENIDEMDPKILGELFQKTLALI